MASAPQDPALDKSPLRAQAGLTKKHHGDAAKLISATVIEHTVDGREGRLDFDGCDFYISRRCLQSATSAWPDVLVQVMINLVTHNPQFFWSC